MRFASAHPSNQVTHADDLTSEQAPTEVWFTKDRDPSIASPRAQLPPTSEVAAENGAPLAPWSNGGTKAGPRTRISSKMNGSSIVWFDDFADGATWNPPTEDVVHNAIPVLAASRAMPRAQIMSDGLGTLRTNSTPVSAELVRPVLVPRTQLHLAGVDDGDVIRQRFSSRPSAYFAPMVEHGSSRSLGSLQPSVIPHASLLVATSALHDSDGSAHSLWRGDPMQARALAERKASIYRPREDALQPLNSTVSFGNHVASLVSPFTLTGSQGQPPGRASPDAVRSAGSVAAAARPDGKGSPGSLVSSDAPKNTGRAAPWASDFEMLKSRTSPVLQPHINGFRSHPPSPDNDHWV
jgi:hypothetical protein